MPEQEEHTIVNRGVRKDGTPRKPIKVRAGYKPQEEIPKYRPPGARRREQDEQKKEIEHVIIERGVRKDGTPRKPIKVRAGYKPQEEVPKYRPPSLRRKEEEQSKKVEEKDQNTEISKEHVIIDRGVRKDGTPRKPIRRKAGYTPQEEIPKYRPPGARRREEQKTKEIIGSDIKDVDSSVELVENEKNFDDHNYVDQGKELKKLQKKLRQIDELQVKVESGDVIPNDDQKNKLSQRNTIQIQVDEMLLQLEDLSIS